jgi:hypothetical protein
MADQITTQANAAGQEAIDAAENAVKEGVSESEGQIATDAEAAGQSAAAGAEKLHDDLIAALKTIIGHVFDGEADLIESAGGNLPFPLNLLAPTLVGVAQKLEQQVEAAALAEVDKVDAALVAKLGAAAELLKADLDKYLPAKS